MKKIAVIFGGKSGEHEVSLSSAMGVLANIDRDKYEIIPIAITKTGKWLIGKDGDNYLEDNKDKAGVQGSIKDDSNYSDGGIELFIKEAAVDLVLPILHGPYGEDGRLQGFLDTLNIHYVFSGLLAHALAMNKPKAKMIFKSFDLPVARDILVSREEEVYVNTIVSELGLPLVVKPAELGSSVGVRLVKKSEELRLAIDEALKLDSEVLVEEYVKGREFTVTVIDRPESKALSVIEVIPLKGELYNYESKYSEGGSRHDCPANIPENIAKRMQAHALGAYKAIGCKDLARVDIIWDEANDKFCIIEVNTIPGMTATSLAPEAARESGVAFRELLDILIENNL